jgi:diphosphomevalonate decarboxylase
MRATAVAQPNIALIKYWGKQNIAENLPATGSLSITLASLTTHMTVELDDALRSDRLQVNGEPAAEMLPRVSACLDHVLGPGRAKAAIDSECNFPIAAGLASSASSFAALVVAASHAAGRQADSLTLARAAGRASGSAARSLYGGFVELQSSATEIQVGTLLTADEWPMQVVVAVTAKAAKKISSGDAMNLSAETSPFYSSWVEHQQHDLLKARNAVAARDFAALADISEHNCLKMHSVMWASRPPVVYWNNATLACMETVRKLQADDVPVFFTIDAGPQVKAVCLPEAAGQVLLALQQTDGVIDTLSSPLGAGARLLEDG